MRLELLHFAILNGVGGTRLGAGRHQAIFHAVITQRAFACRVCALVVTGDDPEGARDDTVATSITDILLHVYRIELGPYERSCRTRFLAGSIGTVFADIAAHQPSLAIEEGQSCSRWDRAITLCLSKLLIEQWNGWPSSSDLFDELHVSPGNSTQVRRVIVA